MRGKKAEKREREAVYFYHQTVMAVGTKNKKQRIDEVQFYRRGVEEIV